jgi:hypothetical protein
MGVSIVLCGEMIFERDRSPTILAPLDAIRSCHPDQLLVTGEVQRLWRRAPRQDCGLCGSTPHLVSSNPPDKSRASTIRLNGLQGAAETGEAGLACLAGLAPRATSEASAELGR